MKHDQNSEQKYLYFSVFSSSILSLKRACINFPKISIVRRVSVCTNKSHCVLYCSLLKSTDLINLENACEYFAIKSLLVVGQVPPLDFM